MAGAGITTVPSPVGGVDYFSSLFGMPPENAIQLVNWWPEVYGCTHRKGTAVWVPNLGAPVGSIYAYHTISGQDKLYAFSGEDMWDVTSKVTIDPPPAPVSVITGLTTDIWQATMFSNSAGTHKVFVSGQDDPIWLHQTAPPTVIYDRLIAGDGTTPGTISGVNPKDFIDVSIHQRRLWFVQKDTTFGWYLTVDQVWGVAKMFDFGPLFKRGGYLQSLATWTVDDGTGSDDILVAFGSEGDVAVYKGTDPEGDESTWSLQGVYYAGPPILGHRFHCKVAGDLKFLTTQGLCSLNDMLTSSRVVSPQSNVESQPVQMFLAQQTSLYGSLPGWDVKYMASINMLLINIPSVTLDGSLAVVENVVNSKWSTFMGYDANCYVADYQDVPFFGTPDGQVIQGWTGNTDNVSPTSPGGTSITALAQQAYNYFGTPANNKQVGIYRPNFLVSRTLQWKSLINYDFTFQVPGIVLQPTPPGTPRWDDAIWDAAFWAGGLRAIKQWASAAGLGFAGSLSMVTRSDGEVVWVNTDFTIASGGIL